MGGSVAVTVREQNGQEHRMCRWTNSLPWFVNNVRLLRKDPSHLREYLEKWEKMKVGAPYGDHPFLAPIDYGIMVVDMQKDVVLSHQGYTTFGKTYVFSSELDEIMDCDDSLRPVRTREFLEAGKVKSVRYLDRRTRQIVNLPVPTSVRSLTEQFKFSDQLEFALDMSPYELMDYKHNINGKVGMRGKLSELGFVISDEENRIWDEWIKEAEE